MALEKGSLWKGVSLNKFTSVICLRLMAPISTKLELSHAAQVAWGCKQSRVHLLFQNVQALGMLAGYQNSDYSSRY